MVGWHSWVLCLRWLTALTHPTHASNTVRMMVWDTRLAVCVLLSILSHCAGSQLYPFTLPWSRRPRVRCRNNSGYAMNRLPLAFLLDQWTKRQMDTWTCRGLDGRPVGRQFC